MTVLPALQEIFIPSGAVEIAQGFFAMVAAIALGVPIIRAISRRWERGGSVPTLPADLTHRLERIEQAVEAVAIEVERMTESQRFTAKLLAEQRALLPGDTAGGDSKANAREAETRRPERGP
jgi:hypothetical protein